MILAGVFLLILLVGVWRWTGTLERDASDTRGRAERARRQFYEQL